MNLQLQTRENLARFNNKELGVSDIVLECFMKFTVMLYIIHIWYLLFIAHFRTSALLR